MELTTETPGRASMLATIAAVAACLITAPSVQATILLHESFGFNTNGIRLVRDPLNPTSADIRS